MDTRLGIVGRGGRGDRSRRGRRWLWGAAAGTGLGLGAALLGTHPLGTAGTARAQDANERRQAALLATYLAAWNAGDLEGVLRHFARDAAVSAADGHSLFVGAGALRDWVRGSLSGSLISGQALTGRVESAGEDRGTWRLVGTTSVDEALRLPPQETLADVQLRDGDGGGDGVIAAMALRGDPRSRERYSSAVATVFAGLPTPPLRPPPPDLPGGLAAGSLAHATVGWVGGAAALVGVAAAAAWPRRPRE